MRPLLSIVAVIVTFCFVGLTMTNDLPRTDGIGQLIKKIDQEEARDAYHADMAPTYCRVFGEC